MNYQTWNKKYKIVEKEEYHDESCLFVKKKRKEKKMTQAILARKSCVSAAMISLIENNKRHPTVFVLVALAKVLGLGIEELIDVEERNR